MKTVAGEIVKAGIGLIAGEIEKDWDDKRRGEAAAAKRAEQAAAAARRAEAKGDADWDRIVNSHRRRIGPSEQGLDAYMELLVSTMARAEAKDADALRHTWQPFVRSFLEELPEECGVDVRRAVALGATVLLVDSLDGAGDAADTPLAPEL
ncbi:hypothetical protein [Streptomyces sp. A1547]|uniref:hypothetical protein n=1 Tax=Streptomyces sp. A1547 TaxID=2563105 RepID=UPI00109E57BF|nr:hypothetical protein [Streptomyces sp. A1547]THA29625.1 hypothetical protein E6W17_39125 [Streptomyces sp. A1547]